MNCGYNYANNCYTPAPAFYTVGNTCGYGGYQNNGWCTFLLVLFIIFIICGVSKALYAIDFLKKSDTISHEVKLL